MRLARSTAFFLTLVIALGIGTSAHAATAGTSPARATDDAALVGHPDALQASAARLEREHRRDSVTSQRWTKHPLMLLAVVSLMALLGLSAQRARAAQHVSRPLTSWWSRSGGRAPPFFQLSVV